jgi:hypothetical protein
VDRFVALLVPVVHGWGSSPYHTASGQCLPMLNTPLAQWKITCLTHAQHTCIIAVTTALLTIGSPYLHMLTMHQIASNLLGVPCFPLSLLSQTVLP